MTFQTENKFNELGRRAYLDSIKSRQNSVGRFKFKSDPIIFIISNYEINN